MAQTKDAPPTGRTEDVMELSLFLYDGIRHTGTLLFVPSGVCLTPYQASDFAVQNPLESTPLPGVDCSQGTPLNTQLSTKED